MPLKTSISGVRGTVPDSLTDEVVLNFTKAFGTYLDGGKVVIGRDTRSTGEHIKEIVIKGLAATGCEIIDIGIAPTPTTQLAVVSQKAKGGIIVTASHNPLPWNGLKFVKSSGIFLNAEEAEKFFAIYYSQKFQTAKYQLQTTNYNQAINDHINKVLKFVDTEKIKSKKFKVAIDPCNGAGTVITEELLHELGSEVVAINNDPNQPFAHPPEPTPANLQDLCALVKNEHCAIGFAQDPDADRLAIVTEEGEPMSEEYTITAAAEFLLSLKKPKNAVIVTNLSTTQAVDDVAKKYSAQVVRTKVGEVYVSEKMREIKAFLGGEGNGGLIVPEIGYGRDSLAAIAVMLWYMAESNLPLSVLWKSLPQYFIAKHKLEISPEKAAEIIGRVAKNYKNPDLTEGLKILLPNGWIHLRPSNTEPIMRIFAEAKTVEAAEQLSKEILNQI